MEIIKYRLKHIPTGLYFIGRKWVKIKDSYYFCTNLDPIGQLFKKARLSSVKNGYRNHLAVNPGDDQPYVEQEWKITKVLLLEVD